MAPLMNLKQSPSQSSKRLLFLTLSLPLVPALCFLFWPTIASARWAGREDASILLKKNRTVYTIRADGTHEVSEEEEIELLKEDARSRYGTQRISYNSRAETLEVERAETQKPGQKAPLLVKPEWIQDKPLASSRQGFDQMNQISVAFPEATLGSTLRLKTRRKVHEVPFPGFFSTQLVYGNYEPEEDSRAEFLSEKELFVEINDPRKSLKIEKTKMKIEGKNWHRIVVEQIKPEFLRAIDEPDPFLPGTRYAWVNLSTTQDWAEMALPLLPEYELRLQAELPGLFEKIAKSAARIAEESARIDRVTSLLAEELHYWADWRPIRGGHIPRPLADIASSRFGDCKDFSIATIAILRKLGLQAYPAWVKRDYRPIFSPNRLPHAGAFNHAIVRVIGAGRSYWIDPTNKVSFATGLFEDIIDRPALVLYSPRPKLEKIEEGRPEEALVRLEVERREGFPGRTPSRLSARMKITGRKAVGLTGEHLNRSRESTDQDLIRVLSEDGKILSWDFKDYDLRSRRVADLDFQFRVEEDSTPSIQSSAGAGYPILGSATARKLLAVSKERVSDVSLGNPSVLEKETLLTGSRAVGSRSLDCTLDSPWISIERKIEPKNTGLLIREKSIVRRKFLTVEESRSDAFRSFQQKLRSCTDGIVLIYEPASDSSPSGAPPS
jgi:hypothetical protein